jgi:hypothetical protein
MNELNIDLLQLMREHPEKLNVPGGLLTKQGPQDYVGSVPAIAGVLFFNGAHLPQVREDICACFDEYRAMAEAHLTWLYREDPPEGPAKSAYSKAKSLREMLARMDEDDALSFQYISGVQAQDAGPWEFQVHGVPAWRVKMGGWGLCALRFSMPLLHVEENPTAFQALLVSFARRLRAAHGYGGHSLMLSVARYDENQAFEAYLTSKLRGFDAGNLVSGAVNAHLGIKTVSWLTVVSHELIEKVGGMSAIRSELPMDWFALYDYGAGIVIQAGPSPEAAPVDAPMPARLVLPNMLFKPVRTPKVRLHFASAESEPRLIGWAAEEWLGRFDIREAELLDCKARLLDEARLTATATLPDRL